MLSMTPIDSVRYYDKLATSEYYSNAQSGEPSGIWCNAIKKIGVETLQVDSNTLKQVMSGFAPDGKKLTQNAGKKDYRVGMDLTFSACKSLSVIWANGSQELRDEISQIQLDSVNEAMQYLQSKVEARRGKDGAIREPIDSLIYATFEHCNTRKNDPQLHSHTVVSNACLRRDGTTGALDNEAIFHHKMACGATYRASLCKRLRERGFSIEPDPKEPSMFQVAGVAEDLQKHFSKRSEEIYKVAEEKGATSAVALSKIALSLRDKKEEVNRDDLFARWQKESAGYGFTSSSIEALKGVEVEAYQLPENSALLETLTELNSTFKTQDIERLLAEQGQFLDFDREAKKAEILECAECVRVVLNGETQYTSKALMDLERSIIDRAQTRTTETAQQLSTETVSKKIAEIEALKGYTLRDEQRGAIEHITRQTGGIALMRGLAGTGKTTALKTVVEAYNAESYTVYGATISAKAASILSEETGVKGQTIAQLLIDLDNQRKTLDAKSVLIIDEAGMLGSREFSRIQQHADKAGCKLVLVGDEKQLQSISAGGIFSALQIHAQLKTADLKTITRQGDERDREASRLFYEGKADEALKIYQDQGLIKTAFSRDGLIEQIAKDFVADTSAIKNKTILTSTLNEALAVNESVREQLKMTGALDTASAAYFENAEGNVLEVSKGERLIFKANSRANRFVNNQTGTVKDFQKQGEGYVITIECDDGKTRKVNTEEYKSLRHAYAKTTHSSQGETVEKAFVLFNRGVADLSSGYVGMTRHKERVRLYCTEADRPILAGKFSKENFKGTTLDLQTSPSLKATTVENGQLFPQMPQKGTQDPSTQVQSADAGKHLESARNAGITGGVSTDNLPKHTVMLQSLHKGSSAIEREMAFLHAKNVATGEEQMRLAEQAHKKASLETTKIAQKSRVKEFELER